MKTPVEWLFDKLWDTPKDKFEWYLLRERALKIEKEQIIHAYNSGQQIPPFEYAEQYYNETYDK